MDAGVRNVTSVLLVVNLHKDTLKVRVVYGECPSWEHVVVFRNPGNEEEDFVTDYVTGFVVHFSLRILQMEFVLVHGSFCISNIIPLSVEILKIAL